MNIPSYFLVIVCAFANCVSADDYDLTVPALCSEEVADQFSKMSDKEKGRTLHKLQAQNTSALLMANFMSEYVNWDEFLYDLPVMVTELGKLMLFSDKRDFSLFRDGIHYQCIQRPESFRATLVQLAHTEWTALHSAHHNMDAIRLNTLSVPGVFRLIFRIINRQKNARNQHLLMSQLNRVLDFARRNRDVCADSVSKINNTINLINELQIATVSAQSGQKDELNVLLKEKTEFEAKVNSSAQMLQVVNTDLTRQLDRVKQLQSEYNDAQRKAKPRMSEIFKAAIIDIVKFAPQMFSSIIGGHKPNSGSTGHSSQSSSGSDQESVAKSVADEELVNEINGAISITSDLDKEIDKAGDEGSVTDFINACLGKVATFRNDALKGMLTSFLDQAKQAYGSAGGIDDHTKSDIKDELNGMSEKLEGEAAAALAQTAASGNSVRLNEKLDHISETSKDTYGQITGARLAKLRAATQMLISGNQQYEKLFNKKLVMMERNNEYISKLAVIDFTNIDFNTILQVMREGIAALGRHIEHWKRFLEFFKIIENLTLLAAQRTQLFVNGTLMGVQDGALMSNYDNDDIYMDMLYEHSFVTIDIAKALHEMTSTYVRISNKHVFPRLNGITKLLALDDPVEINSVFKELANEAQLSSEEFTAELKRDYDRQQQRVKDRVQQLSCYARLLEDDPYVKKAIESNDNIVDIPDF